MNFHDEGGVQNRKTVKRCNSLGSWGGECMEELSCNHRVRSSIQTLRTVCNKHKLDQSIPLNHWKKGWKFATSSIRGIKETQFVHKETQLEYNWAYINTGVTDDQGTPIQTSEEKIHASILHPSIKHSLGWLISIEHLRTQQDQPRPNHLSWPNSKEMKLRPWRRWESNCATLFHALRIASGRWDAEEGHGDPSQACICLMPVDSTV
jgi:hypothetical protein